jgi:hypothetical protein
MQLGRTCLIILLTVVTLVAPLSLPKALGSHDYPGKLSDSSTLPEKYRAPVREFVESEYSAAPYKYGAESRLAEPGSVVRGRWIALDTRDRAACEKTIKYLRGYKAADEAGKKFSCRPDPNFPYATIVMLEPVNVAKFRDDIEKAWENSRTGKMVRETRQNALFMAGMMGLVWLLPDSFMALRDSERRRQGGSFGNVISGRAGSGDSTWVFDWVAAPIATGSYYTIARHQNLDVLDAFGYSVTMSTFFWEYDFQRLGNTPNAATIIALPILGSLLGEAFYQVEKAIQQNNDVVFGSKILGRVLLAILNPSKAITNGINHTTGMKIVKETKASLVVGRTAPAAAGPSQDPDENGFIGIQLNIFLDD